MLTKIESDFRVASDYIDDNYQIVREIFAFLSTFQMPNWEEGKITFN